MKKIFISILIFTIFIFTSCKQEKLVNVEDKYYVISKEDSLSKSNDSIPPPPPPPQKYKWYSNLVFIIDSKNKVYIYQTEYVKNFKNTKLIEEYEYPNYIGLKPENLTTFEINDFIAFVKSNNDIFGLKGKKDHTRFFYIASDKDTIRNKALFELSQFLKNEIRVNYLIRKTTEEENFVLQYKRNKQEFIPEEIHWSSKFINGSCKPFTNEYISLEGKISNFRKAKETFRKNSTIIYPSL